MKTTANILHYVYLSTISWCLTPIVLCQGPVPPPGVFRVVHLVSKWT